MELSTAKQIVSSHEWNLERAPAVLQHSLGFTYGYVKMKNVFGIGHTMQSLFIKDYFGADMSLVEDRRKVFDYIKNMSFNYLYDKYLKWKNDNNMLINMEKVNIKELNDDELVLFYKKHLEKDIRQWSFSIVTESSDEFSVNELDGYMKNIGLYEHQDLLLRWPELSFMEKAGMEKPEVAVKKYSWILNSYKGTKKVTIDYFKSKYFSKGNEKGGTGNINITDVKVIKAEREKLLRKIPKKDRDFINMLSLMGYINDVRKEMTLRTIGLREEILAEIGKRMNIPLDDLVFYLPDEIINRKKVDVKERKKGIFMITYPDRSILFEGEDALELIDISENKKRSENIRGVVANKVVDYLEGNVKIVLDPDKDDFHEGMILVTTMTRPEFLPIMRKAKAIITDEGGITSHAAIISRELGIPCIVGTGHATRILKDNMSVIMKLRHGVIEIKR